MNELYDDGLEDGDELDGDELDDGDDYDDEPCYYDGDDEYGGHTHCFNCGGCQCPGYCDDYKTYNLRSPETDREEIASG